MKNQTLLQGILYEKEKAFLEDTGFSIYEPGDLVQNLSISFKNPNYPYMMLGIWRLPVPLEVKEYLDKANAGFEEYPILIENEIKKMELEANKLSENDKKTVIEIIIPFYKKLHRITVAELYVFEANKDQERIMLTNPTIRESMIAIRKIYEQLGKNDIIESYFIRHPSNLARQFPKIERTSSSTLYNILHDGYVTGDKNPILAVKDEQGNDLYRFIIVDACRSLEEDQPFERAVRRTASSYGRPEICMSNLLRFTKSAFEQLPSLGKLGETSVIKKLLRGEQVKMANFEEELAPIEYENENKSRKKAPYTLPQLTDYHTFSKGQKAIYHSPYDPLSMLIPFGKTKGTVQDINVGNDGSIQYVFKIKGQEPILVPALDLWPSKDVYYLSQSKMEAQHKQYEESIKKQKEKKRLIEESNKKKQEEDEAKRKAAEEEYVRRTAEYKAQQESKESKEKQTFIDLKDMIDALPADKKALIGHTTPVMIQLNPVPPEGHAAFPYHGKKAVVREVVKKTKDNKDYLAVIVEPILTVGEREELKKKGIVIGPREFQVQFIVSRPVETKKGGRRKTKAHRKSKKRTTRRVRKASKY
jgi:hypothetical protein